MKSSLEDCVREEIKRRALQQAARNREQKQKMALAERTLDALQEVTGLSRFELDTIAAEVRASFKPRETDFFSIKRQVLMVFGGLGLLTMGFWFLTVSLF